MRYATRLPFAAIVLAAGLSAACRLGGGGSPMKPMPEADGASMKPMSDAVSKTAAAQPDPRAPTTRDPALSVDLPPCSPGAPSDPVSATAHDGAAPGVSQGSHTTSADGGARLAMHDRGAKMHAMGAQMMNMATTMRAGEGDKVTKGTAIGGVGAGEMKAMGAQMMAMGTMMMAMEGMGADMKGMAAIMKNAGDHAKAKKGGKGKQDGKKTKPAPSAATAGMDPAAMTAMGDEMLEMGAMMEMGMGGMQGASAGQAANGAPPKDSSPKTPTKKVPKATKPKAPSEPAPAPMNDGM